MSYLSSISATADEYRPAIRADLSRALADQKAAAAVLEQLNRRVHFLEALVEGLSESTGMGSVTPPESHDDRLSADPHMTVDG